MRFNTKITGISFILVLAAAAWPGDIGADECARALSEMKQAQAALGACQTGGCEDGEAHRLNLAKLAAENRYTALSTRGNAWAGRRPGDEPEDREVRRMTRPRIPLRSRPTSRWWLTMPMTSTACPAAAKHTRSRSLQRIVLMGDRLKELRSPGWYMRQVNWQE